MTCRESRPLLPLFFDGELEARQMRAVALHSTRCPECEGELRALEHLQEAVATHISSLIDEVDLRQVWSGVAPRLATRAPSLRERWRAWREERPFGWGVRGPAFAAMAVGALLAVVILRGDPPQTPVGARPALAKVDNSAKLDSMQSSVDSVAVVTDAETNTTLLWIMDDAAGTVDHAIEEWEEAE
ncbi:MAG: anti-sigma factor [Candidatus Binatia bacterium]